MIAILHSIFWTIIIYLLNYLSYCFLKDLNNKPEFKDSFTPKGMSYSKIPPLALLIAMFLIVFGTLLIVIDLITSRIKK